MKKLLSALILITLFSLAHQASAQINPDTGGGIDFCSHINNNLQLGSSDTTPAGQVAKLQIFLVNERHLVMPTGVSYGYFGNVTRQAVIKFQIANNISPAVGFVGTLTRAKILQVSCARNNSSAPHIDNISTSTGSVGSNVSIFGQFSSTDTVKFGQNIISNPIYEVIPALPCAGCKGTVGFRFTVPTSFPCGPSLPGYACIPALVAPGTYPVSVVNSNGDTSNSVNFTVIGNTATSTHIDSISPTSGPIGARVTIHGSGFGVYNSGKVNIINFGGHYLPNQASYDGVTLDFTIPADYRVPNPPCGTCELGPPTVTPGRYPVSLSIFNNVSNTFNDISNSVNFTVTQQSQSTATYTNTQYGFSFQYPGNLNVNTGNGQFVNGFNPIFSTNIALDNDGINSVSAGVANSSACNNVDQATGPNGIHLYTGETLSIGGLSFHKAKITEGFAGGSSYKEGYYINHNNYCYMMSFHHSSYASSLSFADASSTFSSILSTFRFSN